MTALPKIIHYCWFSGKPLGQEELRCIASWKKFLPEHEIVRWDETNFDIEACPAYVRQAYLNEKWAFVSDYVRFDVINRMGGLYFDTDVEIIAPFDDILEAGAFMGCEADIPGDPTMSIAAGKRVSAGLAMGMPANHWLCEEVLATYESEPGFTEASMRTTVVERVTSILKHRGLVDGRTIQCIEDVTIYPVEYFNPKCFDTGQVHLTDKTHSIHHFAMSWHGEKERFEYQLRLHLAQKGYTPRAASIISTAVEIIRYTDIKRVIRALRK